MTCPKCDEALNSAPATLATWIYYPYRWKNATVAIIACRDHAKDILDVLNKYVQEVAQLREELRKKEKDYQTRVDAACAALKAREDKKPLILGTDGLPSNACGRCGKPTDSIRLLLCDYCQRIAPP